MLRFFVSAFLVTAAVSFTASAYAGDLKKAKDGPTMDELNVIRANIGPFIHAMAGVVSSGITLCDSVGGTPFYQLSESELDAGEFVNCLDIGVENEATKKAFEDLIPRGTKFQNLFLPVTNTGRIVFQPQ